MPHYPSDDAFAPAWLLLFQTAPDAPRMDLIGEEARAILLAEFGEDGTGELDTQGGETYDECEISLSHEPSPATLAALETLFAGHQIESWSVYDRAN